MQCIITALGLESENFISFYRLEREKFFNFPVFKNSDIMLVQTGVGKANIESRLKAVYSLSEGYDKFQFINIGIAGGNPEKTSIGECHIINKIKDSETGETYYPDILVDHKMSEASIITVNEPVIKGAGPYLELVDMEASEIFRVCKDLVPIQRMAFIKIVSDYMDLDQGNIKKNFILDLVYSRLNVISKFLVGFNKLLLSENSILNHKDNIWISNLVDKWKLTKTQKSQLEDLLKYIRINHSIDFFPKISNVTPKEKSKRNKLFNELFEKHSA